MSGSKRLFLIDAYALIFRGYYAFIKNPRINSKGLNTSAIMGFMNSLLDVIKRERPDYLAVCFDKGGSADRIELYEDYKANRDETPEAIKTAVPYIYNILKGMNIPVVVKEGFEADDIIGTLSKKAEEKGYQTFMVTPDKDFAQLVSDNIFIYRPVFGGGYEVWGIPEVQKKFGVNKPEQVIDFLGMMGDSSDNIPGIPGIGEKTAKKFIAKYGSMENLFANTQDLKGKMKEKVEASRDIGLLSKELATIMLNVPVTFNETDFKTCPPNADAVIEIFQDLEFRQLTTNFKNAFDIDTDDKTQSGSASTSKQTKNGDTSTQFSLFNTDSETPEPKTNTTDRLTAETVPHNYQSINTDFAFNLFLDKVLKQKRVCFDTETTGLNPITAKLVGISFSWEAQKGFYIPVPDNKDEAQVIVEKLRPFFESTTIEKVAHNLKYDIKVLHKYNIKVAGKLYDTMLAHYLINPDMRHNMDILAETYLNYEPIPIEALIGKKDKHQKSMRDVPLKEQTEYAVEDADITLQLATLFDEQLEKDGLKDLFYNIEMPLVQVLADMEMEGINVDLEFLQSLSAALTDDTKTLEKQIYEIAGETFNINSPKQLGTILFEKLKLVDKPKKTKTGQYSTAEEVLTYLANEHEIVQAVLDYRGLSKLQNTYVDALPQQIEPSTKRIHTDYLQAVAATGRLSSNNPNLQNIPIRTARGREIRKAFIPKNDEYVLLAADYSQIELRIIAALSQEETMIKAFKDGLDIHASTAAKVFNTPLNDVSREQRSNAKTINFGIIYGVSAFGLSNQTEMNRTESKLLIETYYKTYPKLRDYIDKQVNFARDNGYVETILGRRRYLRDINSRNAVVRGAAERNAVNAPIQGSAADIIKLAMINIQQKLKDGNYKSKMLLQVHDELVFDIYKPELNDLQKIIKHEMEQAYTLTIPLDVEIESGNNWLEAH